jgi:hypothetical protein
MMEYLSKVLLLTSLFWSVGVPALGAPTTVQQPELEATSPDSNNSDLEAYHTRTRALVKDVLAQSEFANVQSDPYAFWHELTDWFNIFFKSVLNPLFHLPEWVLWIIVAWMLLALLAILAHLIYTLCSIIGGTSVSLNANLSANNTHSGVFLGIQDLNFDTVYAEARRFLSVGDWQAATKYLYVATILWLDRRGCIAFRLSKTNRDYLRELQTLAQLKSLFQRLTVSFELVVYGSQNAMMSTTQDMASTVEVLIHESANDIAR